MGYRENYQAWLRDFAADEQAVAELKAIEGDEKEIEDRFYRNLSFGTAGMRGVLAMGMNRMNVYTVRRATQGLADFLSADEERKRRGVVIAYDSRRMSREFAEETALVLCANGVHVFLFDALRPVPILSYAVRHLHAAAGVVITASHNPPQYNGYKVYAEDGAQISPEVAAEVTAKIDALSFTAAKRMEREAALADGLLQIIGNKEVDDDYIAQVKTLSIHPDMVREEGKNLKIVYTPLHGSGNVPVRRILNEIGITNVSVVKEQENPDPNFSTLKVPNPEDPSAFTLAIKLADEVGADAIFGTDPDCDRLGVAVREKNGSFRLLTGNQIGCLMLNYILSGKKELGTLPTNGAAVKSIVSTELARPICAAYGVELFDTLTGFKFIGEKIQQFEDEKSHTFLFGFEESYGFLSSTFVRDKDGVNASLLIAEAACWYKKTYSCTLVDAIDRLYAQYGYYGDKVTSFVLPGKDGLEKMQHLMRALREDPPRIFAGVRVTALRDYQKSTRVEGDRVEPLTLPKSNVLYFELEDGAWICVRPSGTEPKIKLYVNARTEAREMTAALLEKLSGAAVEALNARM